MPNNYYERIDGKKDLIIALGDSWTAGEGCYTDKIIDDYLSKKITQEQAFDLGRDVFGPDSWPDALAKLMDCDHINLGWAGGANTAMAKRLIDQNDRDHKGHYENVYVIFLLSDPTRINFYSGTGLASYNVSTGIDEPIMKAYISSVMKTCEDADLETIHALKCIDYYCQAKGYKFFYGSAFYNLNNSFNTLFNLYNQNFHNFMDYDSMTHLTDAPKLKSRMNCGHPNQKGYKVIAEQMHSIMVDHKWI